jgi:hypothetical protein
MARPSAFKQADLVRALRAAKIAGVEVGGFRVDATGITVTAAGQSPASDYERWQASQASA